MGSAPTSDKIWEDDLLSRKDDARLLIDFLVGRYEERASSSETGAYVINLNASWGRGKTFFLERLRRQLKSEGYLAAYVNGWKDDAQSEPLVAVMASIEATLKPHFTAQGSAEKLWETALTSGGEILASVLKGASKQFLKRYTGDALDEVSALLGNPDSNEPSGDWPEDAVGEAIGELTDKLIKSRLAEYHKRVASTEAFKSRMARLLKSLHENEGVKLPMFIMVDELDRCRPNYAIQLLEEVKHLFDISGVVFIFATDGTQLENAIGAVYGPQFDGKRYLLRFFNRQYRFADPDLLQFSRFLFSNNIDLGKLDTPLGLDPALLFSAIMTSFHLELRDGGQCFDILRSVTTTWESPIKIDLGYILPLIALFQQGRMPEFEKLSSAGNNQIEINDLLLIDDQRGDNTLALSRVIHQSRTDAHKSFRDFTNGNSPRDGFEVWYYNRMGVEFSTIHNNRLFNGRVTKPLASMYPRIVRNLARLTEITKP